MEDDLAISLCILMAQERFSIVYKHNKETHLKLVGKLFDQVRVACGVNLFSRKRNLTSCQEMLKLNYLLSL